MMESKHDKTPVTDDMINRMVQDRLGALGSKNWATDLNCAIMLAVPTSTEIGGSLFCQLHLSDEGTRARACYTEDGKSSISYVDDSPARAICIAYILWWQRNDTENHIIIEYR